MTSIGRADNVSANIGVGQSARNTPAHVVGVDFGTLSARAVVVRVHDGAEVGTAVHEYRHGVIDATLPATGAPLPPDWALQDPEDYLDVLRTAVPAAVAGSGVDPDSVIGTDFTASTDLPGRADGTPLCRLPQFAGRPHAYVKLWNTMPRSRRPTGSTRWRPSGRSGNCAAGRPPRAAVKAAVMCEDAARTVYLARALGPLTPLDQPDIDALHVRYQNVYGQR